MLNELVWLGVGLVVGAFFPNTIKPRALAVWAKVTSLFSKE